MFEIFMAVKKLLRKTRELSECPCYFRSCTVLKMIGYDIGILVYLILMIHRSTLYIYIYIYIYRRDDTVGDPRRAHFCRFEPFELILLLWLDKQLFPVEPFGAGRALRGGSISVSSTLLPLLRPISLPTCLLRLLDSNFPGNPLWTNEFHPLWLKLCLSQTLWNP